MQLSHNFQLSEAFSWINQFKYPLTRTTQLRSFQEEDMAKNPDILKNIRNIALHLQWIRDIVNMAFPEFGQQIQIIIKSWFRPRRWELFRRRSGASMHTLGHAVDFMVSNVPHKTKNEIMEYIWKLLTNWSGGLARKLSPNNNYEFIHIDLGTKRRWEY